MCALPPKRDPAQEQDTSAYDAWLAQLAEDTKQYVYAVFKTLVATVPKAIIHAQVPRLTACSPALLVHSGFGVTHLGVVKTPVALCHYLRTRYLLN